MVSKKQEVAISNVNELLRQIDQSTNDKERRICLHKLNNVLGTPL